MAKQREREREKERERERERDRNITYIPQTYDVLPFKFYFENKINETHGKTFRFIECLEERG
jgi:hypothetical protein